MRLLSKTAVLLFLAVAFASAGHARAACTSDVRYHLDMGLDFLKEAQAYDDRNETDLAAGEWENLGHQIEMVRADILDCDDPKMNRDFYLLASWDSFHAIDSSSVTPEQARAFRADVSLLYQFGGARYYQADYFALKSEVRDIYEFAGLGYCSPETSNDACRALERNYRNVKTCSADAAIKNLAAPDYPASLEAGLSADVTLSITIDPRGKFSSATVEHEPFPLDSGLNALELGGDPREQNQKKNEAFDAAAIAAARASTYQAKVENCKPIESTVRATFEFGPGA